MALKNIQDKMAALATENAALAAKPELAEGDIRRLEEISAEGQSLKGQIDALKKAGDFNDLARQSAGMISLVGTKPSGETIVEEHTDKAGRKSILVNDDGEMLIDDKTFKAITSPEYARAFKSYLRVGQNGLKDSELKVLQEGIDTSGGYLVNDEILNRLIAKEPAPTNLASKVSLINTTKDAISIPRVVYTTDNLYTSGMRVTWTGEIPASATAHRVTEPSFGQVRIPVFEAMMSLPLTNSMVEDSGVDIVGWCTGKFNETIDLLFDNMIINGGGATQPDGILINANFITNDVHTGAAAALTWDGLINLLYDLPEQYDRNATVVMNKTNTAKALAGLQDGIGRPYWTVGSQDYGLAGGRINRPLEGYPVLFNAFMPNVGAGNYPVIFGDFTGYYMVRRIGFSIQVLRELYAETSQILLLGRVRFGGQLVEDWRVRGQVVSA